MKFFAIAAALAGLVSASTSTSTSSSSSSSSSVITRLVDITTLEWIGTNPELAQFKGILVPAGRKGYEKSFRIVITNLFLDDGTVPNTIEAAIFREWHQMAMQDLPQFVEMFEETLIEFDLPLRLRFLDFLVLKNDFELLKIIVPLNYCSIILNPDTVPQITAHLRVHPGDFIPLLRNYSVIFDHKDTELWKFLLGLGFNQEQMNLVFQDHKDCGIKALTKLCSETDSNYLLRPEIAAQILLIYNALEQEQKLKVQLLMYYRSLLTAQDVNVALVPSSEPEFASILLGAQKELILDYFKETELLMAVYGAARFDYSLIDWGISRFGSSFLNRSQSPVSTLSSIDSVRFSFLLTHKKILAYVETGRPDFLRFLSESPELPITLVSDIIASKGSREELEIFLARADKQTTLEFHDKFWILNSNEEEFFECAKLVIDGVKRFSKHPQDIMIYSALSYKFLLHPEVLQLLQDSRIKLVLGLDRIVSALLEDNLYAVMRRFPHIVVDSFRSEQRNTLSLSAEQLNRLLILLNMTAHEYLKLYLKKNKAIIRLTVDYFYGILLFLKLWTRYCPHEAGKYLNSSPYDIKELLEGEIILKSFDSESLKLIQAFLAMLRSKKKQ